MEKGISRLRIHRTITFFLFIISFVGVYLIDLFFEIEQIDLTLPLFYIVAIGVFIFLMLIWNLFYPVKPKTGLTKTDLNSSNKK